NEYLKIILDKRQELRDRDNEAENEALKKKLERQDYWLEYFGEALGAEQEIREAFQAYKEFLAFKDLEFSLEKAQKEVELAAAVAGAGAAILGKQTAFGKALAVAEIALNTTSAIMRAYAENDFYTATAFAVLIGTIGAMQINKALSTKVPAAPTFDASFETGVTNSQFEGAALVDESGPEIHLDKHGRIKSMGQNKPNIRQVKKGDTIIPAGPSAQLKEILDYNPTPDLMMSLNLNGLLDKRDYDFGRLEKKLDRLDKTIKSKPTPLIDGDHIVLFTESNGSTHQRAVHKLGIIKPKQTGLN